MGETDEYMVFDYYYGQEAEQFAFYRVPRLLIKDDGFKELSNDAKLLYGLMLDRMSLSMKNGWFDSQNRAYIIYTLDQVTADLNCSTDKGTRVLAELDVKKGIGLIEKVRRGLGKPDIIYVKNFVARVKGNADSADRGIQNPQNTDCRNRKKRIQDSAESEAIYTDISHSDKSQTNVISINPICQMENTKETDETETSSCIAIIRKNIEFDYAMSYMGTGQRELFDELYQLVCEVVCVKRNTIKIGGVEFPYHPQDPCSGGAGASDDTGSQVPCLHAVGRDSDRAGIRDRQCVSSA